MEIRKAGIGDRERLFNIWERSVEATHGFVLPEDLAEYALLVRELLGTLDVFVHAEDDGTIPGFIALDGDKIEMLFVDPVYMGRGTGSSLFEFAVTQKGARKLEVNKQNTRAYNFYRAKGFRTVSEDAVDGLGKPYPILHMELG